MIVKSSSVCSMASVFDKYEHSGLIEPDVRIETQLKKFLFDILKCPDPSIQARKEAITVNSGRIRNVTYLIGLKLVNTGLLYNQFQLLQEGLSGSAQERSLEDYVQVSIWCNTITTNLAITCHS